MMPLSFLIKLNLFRLISQCSTTPFRLASRNLGSTWRGDSGGLRSANDEDAVMNVYRTQALLFDVPANRVYCHDSAYGWLLSRKTMHSAILLQQCIRLSVRLPPIRWNYVKTTEPITEITETHTSYYYKDHKSDQESVSDAARDAYAMSHLSAEATGQPYLRSGGVVVPVYGPSAALAVVQPAECEWWPERAAR